MDTQAGLLLPRTPSSVTAARAFTASALHAWGCGEELVDDATLLLSEVAANVVRHVDHGDLRVTLLLHSGRLLVSVHDESAVLPVGRVVEEGAESGRGLMLVEALSACWGANHGRHGKSVWFELAA